MVQHFSAVETKFCYDGAGTLPKCNRMQEGCRVQKSPMFSGSMLREKKRLRVTCVLDFISPTCPHKYFLGFNIEQAAQGPGSPCSAQQLPHHHLLRMSQRAASEIHVTVHILAKYQINIRNIINFPNNS